METETNDARYGSMFVTSCNKYGVLYAPFLRWEVVLAARGPFVAVPVVKR